MSTRRLRILALIILGALIAGFVILVPRGKVQSPTADAASTTSGIPEVTLVDSFKKGTHTISGSIVVYNACVAVATEALVIEDGANPSGIQISITRAPSEGICLELPTRIPFEKKVKAPRGLALTALVDGKTVPITPP